MKVLVLHSEVSRDAGKDEEDVLVQVRWVSEALLGLGYEPVAAPFILDIRNVRDLLETVRPAFVFNLVETVEGSGRLIHSAPAILDHLQTVYTGSGADAVFLTSNKLAAKELMSRSGIATPPWISFAHAPGPDRFIEGPYIIKSVWEHASIGLDEGSVLFADNASRILEEMERRKRGLGGDCFAEAYIEGREFNLSMVAGAAGPEVLPVAEMLFDQFPDGKLKMVDYRAKWESDSFEYGHTVRSFDFQDSDRALIAGLREMATACWRLFGLRGYARVDFRVDASGMPWVLEVNTNPCLSPDAGFAAAAERAGLSFNRVVERIIADSLPSTGEI